jgi:pyruvate ferredoxin oxidoreductase alpha subunit
VRDSGWIQLYCADNQEAVDTTIQAFRIAEETELPVMVCVDGFVLTHTLEPIDLPEQQLVDGFLPAYRFAAMLDPRQPRSLGTLVDPNWFTEVRHAHHQAMLRALPVIERIDAEWEAETGRSAGGLIERIGPKKAKTAILCIGSVASTLTEALEDFPQKDPVKILKLRAFRPFPAEALRKACDGLERLIVLERAFSPGLGGIVGTEVKAALSGMKKPPKVYGFAAGLGGRDMPVELFPDMLEAVDRAEPGTFSILDVQLDKLAPEDR